MKKPKYGFERREEDNKKIIDEKAKNWGKTFSLAFLLIFIMPTTVALLFSMIFIPKYNISNSINMDDYIETTAYRSEECGLLSNNCTYYYTANGESYSYEKYDLFIKFNKIKVSYNKNRPYDTLESNHKNSILLILIIAFIFMYVPVILLHKAIAYRKK